MLHACVERFDVMGARGNILGWGGEVNKASASFTPPALAVPALKRQDAPEAGGSQTLRACATSGWTVPLR
jgi:hypothetical protein